MSERGRGCWHSTAAGTGIALAVIIPIVTGYTLPLGKPAPPTVAVYEYIEKLEPGDVVMFGFDYGPASMPELHPQALALLRHCFDRKLRVLTVSLNVQGPVLASDALARAAAQQVKAQGRVD